MNNLLRNALVWIVLGASLIFLFNNIEESNSNRREQISYSQFRQEVIGDRIAEVTYKGDQMTIHGQRLDGTRFETRHPIYKRDEVVDSALSDNGVVTVFESAEEPSIWSQLLVGAFPILLLLAIFFFFMRQMQGGVSGRGGPMAFGKSKAKLMEGGKGSTTFKDVAGCEEAPHAACCRKVAPSHRTRPSLSAILAGRKLPVIVVAFLEAQARVEKKRAIR